MKTVLLKFSGPLQSWGTDSHFETRHTDSHPSKSGVVGMIAAGQGYRRDDDEKIRRLNDLGFAVRVDQPGQIMREYHTVAKYKDNGDFDRTYVTNRYYLQDAVFVVALSSDDDELIHDVETAVTNPYFSISLGRRSLPPTADFYIGTVDSDAMTALSKLPWQASEWYQKRSTDNLQIFADAALSHNGTRRIRNDIVVSFSQSRGRKFEPRQETLLMQSVTALDKNEDHDIFNAIGGG